MIMVSSSPVLINLVINPLLIPQIIHMRTMQSRRSRAHAIVWLHPFQSNIASFGRSVYSNKATVLETNPAFSQTK